MNERLGLTDVHEFNSLTNTGGMSGLWDWRLVILTVIALYTCIYYYMLHNDLIDNMYIDCTETFL